MTGPQDTADRFTRMIDAWGQYAPDRTFGGLTLDQFKTIAQPAFDARAQIKALEDQMPPLINTRDAADAAGNAKAQLVVNGVIGDVEFGPDSSLYEAMGYVRKSERKTGLTRKKKPADAK